MVEYLMKGVLKGGLRSIKNFSARGYMAGVAVQKTKFPAIDRLDDLSALGAAVNVFDADLLTLAEACDTHEPSQDWGGRNMRCSKQHSIRFSICRSTPICNAVNFTRPAIR